jgi:hypothetical protein
MRKLFCLFAACIVVFTACKKDIDESAATVDFDVKVSFEEFDFPLSNIQVKIENDIFGVSRIAATNAAGIASFKGIPLGTYTISANVSLTPEQYFDVTGIDVQSETVNFNGFLANVNAGATANTTHELKLDVGRVGNLLIKQLYYAGSNSTNGASIRDAFVEIYNNSNEVIYADSLYFSQVKGVAKKFSTQDMSPGYYIDDVTHALYKQFDWSKSLSNITGLNADAYNNYLYVESAFMIPGSGSSHPIQPGESIIIAANAINHQAPYIGNDNKPVPIPDPSLTVDLSNVDWEVYYGDQRPDGQPSATDIDNPAVPNVKVYAIKHNNDMILDPTGRDAFVIYKLPKEIINYPRWATPEAKVIDINTDLYYQIPIEYIIDGLQTLHPNAEGTSRNARKLNNKIDAGPTWVSGGQYSSQSLMRKTAKIIDGRIVLQDTNNSVDDFVTMERPVPYGFAN